MALVLLSVGSFQFIHRIASIQLGLRNSNYAFVFGFQSRDFCRLLMICFSRKQPTATLTSHPPPGFNEASSSCTPCEHTWHSNVLNSMAFLTSLVPMESWNPE